MPWVKDEFRWTTDEKLADLLSGVYGDEFDEKSQDLNDLVEAVRRDWAAEIAKAAKTADPELRAAWDAAADLVNPDTSDKV
jgi:hypothetical protein